MATSIHKIEGKPQFGIAVWPSGEEMPAEFCLQGRETYVIVHESEVRRGRSFDDLDLLSVRMTDGTHVTFIDNIVSGVTSYHGTGGSVVTYLPKFATVGTVPLASDYEFKSVTFLVDDAESIFYDCDAFSVALDADKEVKQIVAAQSAAVGRPIELGDRPIVTYFTGKFEILSVDSPLGLLKVCHRPSHGMGGPSGIAISNRIVLQLDLSTPVQVLGLVDSLMPHLRFLQVIAGRKQKVEAITVSVGNDERQPPLQLLWSLAWSRQGGGKGPHPADLPVNGGFDPVSFSKVMAAWLKQDEERADARVRFAGSFSQGRSYSIDRLISAANMFDILPSCCVGNSTPLPGAVEAVREAARQAFKALPPSDHRDRALDDLGRLGQLNLKAKVLRRCERLLNAPHARFPNLEQVLRNAVDSRNHYVHGTAAPPEKVAFYKEMLSFHVDALEFVFGAADLLDAGWDYAEWSVRGTTMSHPFGEFRANYEQRISRYMAKLQACVAGRS